MAEPVARITPKGAARARSGHPWIFRADVVEPPGAATGELVRVTDLRGNLIGRAYWAVQSPIALRLVARLDEPAGDDVLSARFAAAVERRRRLMPGRDAYRAVHAEADGLPGVFVDVYGDCAAVQTHSEAASVRDALWVELAQRHCGARTVVLRNDTSARDFEKLPRFTRLAAGGPEAIARYHEGASVFEVDLLADQKTGGYLDQVDNHVRAGELARGEALDAFAYHGGFALALARRATSVTAFDIDPLAVERVKANAARNGLGNVVAEQRNAFDALHELDKSGRKFATIVVDPPALAKRASGVEGASRAYFDLNLRAMRCLEPGGLLVTCSCSGKMTPDLFVGVLREAAADAHRQIQIFEKRGAGADHPGLVSVPELEYLKAWFCFVL